MNFMQGQRLAQILLSVGGLLTTRGSIDHYWVPID